MEFKKRRQKENRAGGKLCLLSLPQFISFFRLFFQQCDISRWFAVLTFGLCVINYDRVGAHANDRLSNKNANAIVYITMMSSRTPKIE